jgi:hypothetical protein
MTNKFIELTFGFVYIALYQILKSNVLPVLFTWQGIYLTNYDYFIINNHSKWSTYDRF